MLRGNSSDPLTPQNSYFFNLIKKKCTCGRRIAIVKFWKRVWHK
eukprot:UN20475